MRSVVTFLDDLTRRGPVILWLSDLHWADAVVHELLTTALTTLARRPLVLLTTARRSLLKRWTPPIGRFDTFALNLEALDAAATEQLIDVLLSEADHEALGEAARAELRERSGGNPLFLVELLALLDDQQVAALDGGRGDSLSDMPDTLRGLVAARLDHLVPSERALIDDAAVLGRRGRIEHLAEMARQIRGVAQIADEVDAAVARDLLRVDGDIWEFRSDLTREVAYRMLTKSDRAEKHLGVARWVEAQHEGTWNDRTVDLLAHHYGLAAELLADLGAVGQLSGGVRGRALHWIDEVSARGERLRLLPAVERLCTQGLALADDEHAATRLTLLVRRARRAHPGSGRRGRGRGRHRGAGARDRVGRRVRARRRPGCPGRPRPAGRRPRPSAGDARPGGAALRGSRRRRWSGRGAARPQPDGALRGPHLRGRAHRERGARGFPLAGPDLRRGVGVAEPRVDLFRAGPDRRGGAPHRRVARALRRPRRFRRRRLGPRPAGVRAVGRRRPRGCRRVAAGGARRRPRRWRPVGHRHDAVARRGGAPLVGSDRGSDRRGP